jgi:hypothetical protein
MVWPETPLRMEDGVLNLSLEQVLRYERIIFQDLPQCCVLLLEKQETLLTKMTFD